MTEMTGWNFTNSENYTGNWNPKEVDEQEQVIEETGNGNKAYQ